MRIRLKIRRGPCAFAKTERFLLLRRNRRVQVMRARLGRGLPIFLNTCGVFIKKYGLKYVLVVNIWAVTLYFFFNLNITKHKISVEILYS